MTRPLEERFGGRGNQKGDIMARGWCYRCGTSHLWDELCFGQRPMVALEQAQTWPHCAFCGVLFERDFHHRNYCSLECRTNGKRAAKRALR
jgi:hypothetical protein